MKEFGKLLYVEDDPLESEVITRLYQTVRAKFHGAVEFKTVQTWEAAVQDVQDARPDVIIADLTLPPDNSETTLKAIKSIAYKWPPILVLTGNGYDLTLRRRAILAGADDFMLKTDARHGCIELLVERVYHCFLRRLYADTRP